MAVYLGVDFGTRTIEIYQRDKGIILREPNIAAVDSRGNVVAVGSEASLMRGRAPGTVTIRRPIVNGEMSDFNLTAEILDRCLEIAAPRQKKHIIAAVKYSLGISSRELLSRALSDCRTGRVKLVDSALAAHLGCGIELVEDEYSGNIVCDIGAGSIEAAYVRGGELLRVETAPFAGEAADTAIINYISARYGLALSPLAAREAKHKLSLESGDADPIVLTGLDKTTGMPKRLTVDSSELLTPCTPLFDSVSGVLLKLLANLPHHGASRSSAQRIVLVGGGAAIPGLAKHTGARIGREVTLAKEPLDCVANGLGVMLDNYK